MSSPSILDILRTWLEANGYDGLCSPEIECGCQLCDLMPCQNFALGPKTAPEACKAGYADRWGRLWLDKDAAANAEPPDEEE